MRSRSKAVAKAETPVEEPSGSFLLVKPARRHQRCEKPSFTPWTPDEDKFGRGTIWQCAECQRVYLVTGEDPVGGGFWTEISARRAKRLLKKFDKHKLIP